MKIYLINKYDTKMIDIILRGEEHMVKLRMTF